MTELMDPTLAARALSAATEITSTALSGDDPGAVLDTVVARAAELADADLGLAMVSADDGRVVVEAAHYATAHPAETGYSSYGDEPRAPVGDPSAGPGQSADEAAPAGSVGAASGSTESGARAASVGGAAPGDRAGAAFGGSGSRVASVGQVSDG